MMASATAIDVASSDTGDSGSATALMMVMITVAGGYLPLTGGNRQTDTGDEQTNLRANTDDTG